MGGAASSSSTSPRAEIASAPARSAREITSFILRNGAQNSRLSRVAPNKSEKTPSEASVCFLVSLQETLAFEQANS